VSLVIAVEECSKMASFGADWVTNWATQIRWGLDYIKHQYGTPAAAWAHSQRTNWYAGGTPSARRGLAWVGERGPELVDFRGGESVYPHDESLKVATAALRAPVESAVIGSDGDAADHYHAHFDGWTRASAQHEVTTAFHSMSVEAGQSQRIGRRR
jgi:phage-related tail protein